MKDYYKNIKNFFKNISQEYIIDDLTNETKSPELVAENDPNSFIVEQYRNIAFGIRKLRKQNGSKVFLFTSPQPQDGKTTTVANLGVVLAKDFNKKVLIIDGDLRRPNIHKIFQKSNKIGFADMLLEKDLNTDYIVDSEIKNLSLLLAGRYSPENFLGNDEIKNIINKLKYEYDFVLIDSAPILKVTDATVLGQYVDATILVIKAQNTPSKLIKEAKQLLKNHEVNPVASILVNHCHLVDLYSYCVNPHYRNYYSNYYEAYGKTDTSLEKEAISKNSESESESNQLSV